jgi:4-amino-4-deoxy-L-arabinose transferase-like glycosyltransferase
MFVSFSFLVIVGYFILRLVNLTIIPVFADEAIYIRWSQVMRAEASLRFLPLSDGKQPLFMWLTIPFLKLIRDPLVAGRMVSVLSGFGNLIGLFTLSYLLFKRLNLSLFAAVLYLTSPFGLFFDRLALADNLLSCLFLWTFILFVLLTQEVRLDLAMIGGIFLGLALLTKSPAFFLAILLPTTLILFDFRKKEKRLRLGKLFFLWLVVYLFGLAIYNILRLGPEFHMIAIRNKDYVYSLSEVLSHPLNPLLENLGNAASWLWILATPPLFILGILGMVMSFRKHPKEALILLTWLVFPLVTQSLVAKVYTARYLLFLIPFFLVFSAYFIEFIFSFLKNKVLTIVALILIFIFPVFQEMLLINAPAGAWLPENERKGYLEMWTAGYGIKETAIYLKEVAKKEKVLVGTEGYFGTLPNGLQMYLERVPNTTVIGVGYPLESLPEQLLNGLVDNRVFLLVNDTRFKIKETQNLKLVGRYSKAGNKKTQTQENLLLFELLK